jgi:hypothetical protein
MLVDWVDSYWSSPAESLIGWRRTHYHILLSQDSGNRAALSILFVLFNTVWFWPAFRRHVLHL